MYRFAFCASATLAVLAGLPFRAGADEVLLANGDRLTGNLIKKEGETLVFATAYAGEISVKWGAVANLVTDATVTVVLNDHTVLNGRLLPTEKGRLKLKAGEIIETAPFDPVQVSYINPPPEVTGKKVRLKGRVNVGAALTQGNSDTEKYYLDTELVARTPSNRFTIGAVANRARDDGNETVNNTTGYMKYDHFLDTKWYSYANGTFTQDKFKDLNLRTSLGVGIGYQFWENDKNLSLEGGLAYVNEDFANAPDSSYPAGRWALKFDHYLFRKRTQFFHFHEGLVGIEDPEDLVVRAQTGLRFPFTANLNATAQWNFDWDNSPAPGNDAFDESYVVNIGYSW